MTIHDTRRFPRGSAHQPRLSSIRAHPDDPLGSRYPCFSFPNPNPSNHNPHFNNHRYIQSHTT